MSYKVHVYNDNSHPLDTFFKGDKVFIDAKDFWLDKKGQKKIMDIYEANDFAKTYHAVPLDGSGKMLQDPKYFKIIKLVPIDDKPIPQVIEKEIHKCMAPGCVFIAQSAQGLKTHSTVKHPNIETLEIPE